MRKAFSLVEVLTVMLIIAILMAAVFPVLFQAKARAKQTVCESNLHQVYLGIKLYEQDYDQLPYLAHDDPNWYKHYTGGTMLRCQSAEKIARPIDYIVTAGMMHSLPSETDLSKKWQACSDARGTDFPYAYDPNHVSAKDGYQGAGQRVVLVRASGSVVNVPFRQFNIQSPCDMSLGPFVRH